MTRKIIVLFLSFVLLLSSASCSSTPSGGAGTSDNSSEYAETTFSAIILEINGNSVLVEPLDGDDIPLYPDRITFSCEGLDNIDPCVGDIVSVTFNGIIMESYPAQIAALKWSEMEWNEHYTSEYDKPVIYLYPDKEMDISVFLECDGGLDFTYPSYNNGWFVRAKPDGTIINKADDREYSYLFWEGHGSCAYDLTKGFVVKGSDTVDFLREKLSYMGLTAREYNEFIVYWAPMMEGNPYNFITFQGEEYTSSAKLTVSPEPDSLLRVFMTYQPLDEAVSVEEQELSTFERKGFSVIEWGGTVVNAKK